MECITKALAKSVEKMVSATVKELLGKTRKSVYIRTVENGELVLASCISLSKMGIDLCWITICDDRVNVVSASVKPFGDLVSVSIPYADPNIEHSLKEAMRVRMLDGVRFKLQALKGHRLEKAAKAIERALKCRRKH